MTQETTNKTLPTLLLLLLALTLTTLPLTTAQEGINSGLTAHYELNTGSGSNAFDSSENSHTATIDTSNAWTVAYIETGLDTTFLILPESLENSFGMQQNNDWTISFIIEDGTRYSSGTAVEGIIYSEYYADGTRVELELETQFDSSGSAYRPLIQFTINDSWYESFLRDDSCMRTPAQLEHNGTDYFHCVFKKEGNQITTYQHGTPSQTITINESQLPEQSVDRVSTAFFAAADTNTQTPDLIFDEVSFYNHALTNTQISRMNNLYAEQLPPLANIETRGTVPPQTIEPDENTVELAQNYFYGYAYANTSRLYYEEAGQNRVLEHIYNPNGAISNQNFAYLTATLTNEVNPELDDMRFYLDPQAESFYEQTIFWELCNLECDTQTTTLTLEEPEPEPPEVTQQLSLTTTILQGTNHTIQLDEHIQRNSAEYLAVDFTQPNGTPRTWITYIPDNQGGSYSDPAGADLRIYADQEIVRVETTNNLSLDYEESLFVSECLEIELTTCATISTTLIIVDDTFEGVQFENQPRDLHLAYNDAAGENYTHVFSDYANTYAEINEEQATQANDALILQTNGQVQKTNLEWLETNATHYTDNDQGFSIPYTDVILKACHQCDNRDNELHVTSHENDHQASIVMGAYNGDLATPDSIETATLAYTITEEGSTAPPSAPTFEDGILNFISSFLIGLFPDAEDISTSQALLLALILLAVTTAMGLSAGNNSGNRFLGASVTLILNLLGLTFFTVIGYIPAWITGLIVIMLGIIAITWFNQATLGGR